MKHNRKVQRETMMQDIRLLKLLKQHYQDKFETPLVVKYSSWGYYDGFEVIQTDDVIYSKLFAREAESPFSDLYYGAGEEISKINVGKSLQIIGLFRYLEGVDENIQYFWEMADRLPFFAIGFLKIDGNELEDSAYNIESCFHNQFDAQKEKGCLGLTYFTYDNADLIVLLSGNSIEYMMGILREIEKKSFVSYMHNIFGVAEALLQDSESNKVILDNWQGISCYTEDSIAYIEMKFVTSGEWNRILEELKYVFDETNKKWNIRGYDEITYTYISGHENLILKLKDTDVRSLLALLTPEGFLTHQNEMYERGVYNIETSIYLKEERWKDICGGLHSHRNSDTTEINAWCQRMIGKYSEYISKELQAGDEGFYSYFQALLLTLNTLNQYERFSISRDIFLMIYPALDLFDKMFTEAYEEIEKEKQKCCINYERMGKLKDVLCNFITNINSVIYHTIHTDQVFLMIPGYSGTSYSIPIKLNIMYYWFMDAIKNILNDGQTNCQFVLVPNMEANPKTYLFDFGINKEERLVHVSFSQRTLFLPKNLMIILAHEVGHYVGREIRMRERRWNHLLISITRCIIEDIMYDISDIEPSEQEYKELYDEYTKYVLNNLEKEIYVYLSDFGEQYLQGDYHGEKVEESLQKGIYQMLTLKNGNIEKVIRNLPKTVEKKLNDEEKFYEYSCFISELQEAMLEEFQGMAYRNWMKSVIGMLMYTYREVFSDMAALAITRCNFRDFCEAYQVSEGVRISDENASPEQCVREFAANQVVYENKKEIHFHGLGRENKEPYVVKNLYSFEYIRKEITQYADECYQAILVRINQPEYKGILDEVRKLFCIFHRENEDCLDTQHEINLVINQYIQTVEEKYIKECKCI